jgi:hypothetical protein
MKIANILISSHHSITHTSKDLNAVNSFIAKLPNLPSRSSIQPMIKKIYTNCMNIRSEERTDENLQVLKTILETAREYKLIVCFGMFALQYGVWMFLVVLFFHFRYSPSDGAGIDILFWCGVNYPELSHAILHIHNKGY